MRSLVAILTTLALALAAPAPPPPTDSLTQVAAAFTNAGLVGTGAGTVIDQFNPIGLISVEFPQADGTFLEIDLGTQIDPTLAQGTPVLAIEIARAVAPPTGTEFVAFIVDPDAPSPADPSSAQIRHMFQADLVINPTGRATAGVPGSFRQLEPTAAAFTPFMGPHPTVGSGFHRYTLLVFTQPAGFDTSFTLNETNRANFDLRAFAAATGLTTPIGGNFFLAEQN